MAKNNKRLLSLDILRGITIAGMLLVNNPGSWSNLYAPLEHAEWIGLTPTDLVFPFFMFVMGVSMYFSLRKFNFKPSGSAMLKICRRTIVLFLIGWMVQWFGMWLRGLYDPESHFFARMFGDLRILGVFQRLALVYFFGSIIALLFKSKFITWIIGLILIVYAIILGTGNGYKFSLENILSRVDMAVLGEDHMYHEQAFGKTLALDPEGLLSTLPCIAHVLIGFMMGKCINTVHAMWQEGMDLELRAHHLRHGIMHPRHAHLLHRHQGSQPLVSLLPVVWREPTVLLLSGHGAGYRLWRSALWHQCQWRPSDHA